MGKNSKAISYCDCQKKKKKKKKKKMMKMMMMMKKSDSIESGHFESDKDRPTTDRPEKFKLEGSRTRCNSPGNETDAELKQSLHLATAV